MQAGVYQITNTTNGRMYIGSSNNIQTRWRGHRRDLQRGTHANKDLQNAWHKYGASAFQWRVLLVCRPEDRLLYEQRCIDGFDVFRNGYNKCPNAGNGKGIVWSPSSKKRQSDRKRGVPMRPEARANHKAAMGCSEVRAKMSKARRDWAAVDANRILLGNNTRGKKLPPRTREWYQKMAAARRGIKHTPARCAAISAALRGKKRPRHSELMKGRTLSPEHREAITAGLLRRSPCYEFNGRSQTLVEWSRESGISYETVRKRIQRGVPLHLALTVKRFLKMPRNLKETA